MSTSHENRERQAAESAITQGHADPTALRRLLIFTTSKNTSPAVEAYFRAHHGDGDLVSALVAIALEGEDEGDAPWAAANVLADFPASMLRPHEEAIVELSQNQWRYLNVPATRALAKLRG